MQRGGEMWMKEQEGEGMWKFKQLGKFTRLFVLYFDTDLNILVSAG